MFRWRSHLTAQFEQRWLAEGSHYRLQLAAVLPVCAQSASLSEAGRRLFAQSRQQRKAVNDSDRLRKYLLRFGLSWEQIRQGMTSSIKP